MKPVFLTGFWQKGERDELARIPTSGGSAFMPVRAFFHGYEAGLHGCGAARKWRLAV